MIASRPKRVRDLDYTHLLEEPVVCFNLAAPGAEDDCTARRQYAIAEHSAAPRAACELLGFVFVKSWVGIHREARVAPAVLSAIQRFA